MRVDADLQLVVAGRRAHLTGSGTTLLLESDDPAALWSSVTGADLPAGLGRISGPRAVGRLADQLRDVGLQLRVTGPSGELVRLGAGSPSRWGRLTTGSSAVGIGSVRAITPVGLTVFRQAAATASAAARRLLRRRH